MARSQYIERWKRGEEVGYTGKTKALNVRVRRYMLEKYNFTCVMCGWDERHPADNLPLVEVDHIDGDASNCVEENLRVLCPNCHSKTSTYRARNKNSSRVR